MRGLNDTITQLAALRARASGIPSVALHDRLTDLESFGSNPGNLRGRCYVPSRLKDGAALVVVLHGCTQSAAGYDHGAGWSRLADEHGFALLYPEQQRANNANLCFNWFNVEDIRRGGGEALSIRQMVAAMVATHRLAPTRIFVTGLSAGGAMASVMLATYPEVFAGGAIIAGLPYGTARSIPQALDRMRAHGGPGAPALGDLVATASGHSGAWPIISVWHGDSDATVHPANASLVVEQWRALHGAAPEPLRIEQLAGHTRSVWGNAEGREVIEEYRIAGLGHGTPLATTGSTACGAAGAYMLEAGISSTRRITDFWGLAAGEGARNDIAPLTQVDAKCEDAEGAAASQQAIPQHRRAASHGSRRVIEDALRSAGLMR